MFECPNCGETDLGDEWCAERKLRQFCRECGWRGKLRIPEKRKITVTKKVYVDDFGWNYLVYDRYGHVFIDSATYDSKAEAIKELQEDLIHGIDAFGGPYTGVLFNVPGNVVLKGDKYKISKKDKKLKLC